MANLLAGKMPWSSRQGHTHKDDKENQSLTTILDTPDLRAELTLLLANATESMRKTITDAFDADATAEPPTEQATATDTGAQGSSSSTGNDSNDTAEPADEEAQAQARKEREQRERELSAPRMQELRDAALSYFDTWRDSVLRRVGETVNASEAAETHKAEAEAQSQPAPDAGDQKLQADDAGTAGGRRDHDDTVRSRKLGELYPPADTPLARLGRDKRVLVLHSMLLLLLGLEHYSAHSRVLLLRLASSLRLGGPAALADDEAEVARGLLEAAGRMSADEETRRAEEQGRAGRAWKVGLASVAGAAVVGITGGLAAPLLAAGVGSVMGGLGLASTAAAGYLGALAGSGVLVGGLFGAYGGRMTGRMMDQYAAAVRDFAFVPVRQPPRWPNREEKERAQRRLRVAVGVGGWLAGPDEVVEPWRVLGGGGIEAFALRYELEALVRLGNALTAMLRSAAWGYAKREIVRRTVFAALTAGLWPLGLLKVSRVVDNPFSVAKARSDKAGEVLADALANRAQGERPVTLVGYSLGARVVYRCLQSLADRRAFGLVESVVLLGAPTPSDAPEWRRLRSVVSGRVVNVYSTQDYVLGFLYRTSSIQYGIAGLQRVKDVRGVENVDVSDLVEGHTKYRYLVGRILERIGFEDVDVKEAEREVEEMEKAEEEERKLEEGKEEGNKAADSEAEAADLEKEVEQKSQMSLVTERTAEKLHLGPDENSAPAAEPHQQRG